VTQLSFEFNYKMRNLLYFPRKWW